MEELPRGALGTEAVTTEGYAGRLCAGKRQGLTATGLGGGAAARRPRHGGRNNRGLCRQTAGGAF